MTVSPAIGAQQRGLGALKADVSNLADFLADAYTALAAAEKMIDSPHSFTFDHVALKGAESHELERKFEMVKNAIGDSDSHDLRTALLAAEGFYEALDAEIKRTDDA
jgi:K+-sensing histidine kinase KdpD